MYIGGYRHPYNIHCANRTENILKKERERWAHEVIGGYKACLFDKGKIEGGKYSELIREGVYMHIENTYTKI